MLSLLKDGTHGTHQDAEEGPYLLSAKNIKNGQIIIDDSSDRKISEDEFNQIHTKFTLKNGDILLTIVGSIGESAILESAGKFTFQRSVAFLRPSEEMTSRFLKTEIESVQFQKELNDRKSQSAQPGVYLGDLSKIAIYITSKEEQKKIGKYFSYLDNLITLHQRKYFIIYNKLITWEQRKLGEVGTTYTGLSGKTADDFGHGEASFITYMNVFSHPVANSEMVEHVEIDNKQREVQVGDVFFTTSSETPEEVGMSSVLKEKHGVTYLNSFCFGFRPNVKFDLDYLAYMLRSEPTRSQIKILAQGISRFNISKNKMMDINIQVPNLEEQAMVGAYFRNLDHLITLHRRAL